MNDGELMGLAFQAIRRCHFETGKLIRDFDKAMKNESWTRLWTGRDAVTYGVSKSLNAEHWMPERIYRYYKNPAFPNVVEGINICFFGSHPLARVPLLIAGKAKYFISEDTKLIHACQVWDFIEAVFSTDRTDEELGQVIAWNVDDRIEHLNAIAVDLYSVKGMGDVNGLVAKVRESFALATEEIT